MDLLPEEMVLEKVLESAIQMKELGFNEEVIEIALITMPNRLFTGCEVFYSLADGRSSFDDIVSFLNNSSISSLFRQMSSEEIQGGLLSAKTFEEVCTAMKNARELHDHGILEGRIRGMLLTLPTQFLHGPSVWENLKRVLALDEEDEVVSAINTGDNGYIFLMSVLDGMFDDISELI